MIVGHFVYGELAAEYECCTTWLSAFIPRPGAWIVGK